MLKPPPVGVGVAPIGMALLVPAVLLADKGGPAQVAPGQPPSSTVVAPVSAGGDNADTILREADRALYESKRNGRNIVTCQRPAVPMVKSLP